jgi:hypothetical protein
MNIKSLDINEPKYDLAEKRHEHLHKTYETLVQLIMYEGAFISDRTNIYLLFNSILFATLFILPSQTSKIDVLRVTLPVIGLIMSVFHSAIIAHTIEAGDFWLSSVCLIEEDQDFWYPKKVKNDNDLDVFAARERYKQNMFAAKGRYKKDIINPTRQEEHPVKFSQPPEFLKKLYIFLPKPNRMYVFWLPFLMCILWFLAFIWALTTIGSVAKFL